ncbi:hypothetical protein RD1_0811 [Roseobacter denitrificans OCh 114]|uniref:Uncharacterized protein n=1 Tax=Roseobacter denitrificans (strain ATCC 33942 / OCh 114) TaxID=375451 RepID=Q16C04_ROSDO|nr:hypothetical protein RD1_0811 [Roseobacter denitrificans OCh 114]
MAKTVFHVHGNAEAERVMFKGSSGDLWSFSFSNASRLV